MEQQVRTAKEIVTGLVAQHGMDERSATTVVTTALEGFTMVGAGRVAGEMPSGWMQYPGLPEGAKIARYLGVRFSDAQFIVTGIDIYRAPAERFTD